MLILQTQPKSLFSIERWKAIVSSIQKRVRGPRAVIQSLTLGLQEMKVPFSFNTPSTQDDILHVVNGVDTLKEGIKAKKAGLTKKLIAGPTIVVSPLEKNRILCDSAIDTIIVPCAWVRDFYISQVPTLRNKIKVWAAGVQDPGEPSLPRSERLQVLVYQKNAPEELLQYILNELSAKEIPFTVVNYGFFQQEEYYRKLASSAMMIYLSQSESQGIALHEAWIRDVPTLVWNKGIWTHGPYTWKDTKISAPYLTDTCGYFFTNGKDFGAKFDMLIKNYAQLRPRQYSLENFTDTITTKKYLTIINS